MGFREGLCICNVLVIYTSIYPLLRNGRGGGWTGRESGKWALYRRSSGKGKRKDGGREIGDIGKRDVSVGSCAKSKW